MLDAAGHARPGDGADTAHVSLRKQFGQPLSTFQGVQFQLTDAEVERSGVEELAKYALWSIEAGRPEALDDALALRLAAIEAAEVVFRVCHQLHGAIGFCDETTLSWLSRYSQPLRRLPLGLSATRDRLTPGSGTSGLPGCSTPWARDGRPELRPARRADRSRPTARSAPSSSTGPPTSTPSTSRCHWALANVWRQLPPTARPAS